MKTEYNAKIKNIEDIIPDISSLATKTILNTKKDEVKNEIPSISGLATTFALTAVENKMLNVSNLIKKKNYDTKVNEIEIKITDHEYNKYLTLEFDKLTKENFDARLAQSNLVTKTDFDNKLSNLNQIIVSNKGKHLVIENELKNLETFDLSYFRGSNHFEENDIQNYFIFQPIYRFFKTNSANNDTILSWRSKGLSDQSIKAWSTSSKFLNALLNHVGSKIRINFDGGCLKK